MEAKGKVVCVEDKACENGFARKRRGCIENDWIE